MAERKATPPAAASPANDAVGDIVVTAARVSRRSNAAAQRGDWNACTVEDPERSLRGCKDLVRIGAKGVAGEAATHLADGVTHAWQGDANAAVTAFGAAVALQPKLAFAYLNRALAERRLGDLDRAAADLDLAIRYAPSAARGYYYRALVRRQRGDTRRAARDEDRAVTLDPDYGDLFDR